MSARHGSGVTMKRLEEINKFLWSEQVEQWAFRQPRESDAFGAYMRCTSAMKEFIDAMRDGAEREMADALDGG